MNASAATFSKVASRVYIARVALSLLRSDGYGSFEAVLPFRIDGREGNFYRVDMGDMGIWEAIDGGRDSAPKTLKAAKALAQRYISAVREQGTMSPKLA